MLKRLGAAVVIILADYLVVLTDCITAGRVVGETALGAMNVLMPVFSLASFCYWAIACGTSAAYARAVSRGDEDSAAGLAGQGLIGAALAGVFLVVLARGLIGPYLAFLDVGPSVNALVQDFFGWYQAVLPLQAVYMMLFYLFYGRGWETACISSYVVLVIGNAAFSYGLSGRMGLAGLSLGTVLSMACASAVLLLSRHCLRPDMRIRFRFDVAAFARSLRLSLPDTGVWLFQAALFLAIAKYVSYFWDEESMPVCAVVFCIIRVTAFFAGQWLALRPLSVQARREGERMGEISRYCRIASVLSFASMVLLAAIFYIAPELLIGLFGIESADLIEGCKFAARITVVGLLTCGLAAYWPLRRGLRRSKAPQAALNYLQGYVIHRLAEDPTSRMFNLAKFFRLKKGIDLERLSHCLLTSARSHAALRTVFRTDVAGEIVQRLELNDADLACPIVKTTEAELLARRPSLVKSFDVFGKSLFQAVIYDCGDCAYLLSNFHHLICDGYSFPVILEDAHRVWQGETLTPDSYYDVLERRAEKSAQPLAEASRTFLRETFRSKPFVTLPADDFRGAPGYGAMEFPVALPEDFAAFLTSRRLTRHHVFLAATVLALSRLTEGKDMLVDWVFHGRLSKEELKTVGAFMVDLPLVVEGVNEMTSSDLLAHVKRTTFSGIKNVNVIRDVRDCNPLGQDRLTFIYQDEWGELMSPGPVRPDGPYAWMIEETVPLSAPAAATENPFNVEIMEHRDSTRLFVEYDTGRYAQETVHRYARLFMEALTDLVGS